MYTEFVQVLSSGLHFRVLEGPGKVRWRDWRGGVKEGGCQITCFPFFFFFFVESGLDKPFFILFRLRFFSYKVSVCLYCRRRRCASEGRSPRPLSTGTEGKGRLKRLEIRRSTSTGVQDRQISRRILRTAVVFLVYRSLGPKEEVTDHHVFLWTSFLQFSIVRPKTDRGSRRPFWTGKRPRL